jgi:DNA adenine methylase
MIKGPFSYSGNKWRIWNKYLNPVFSNYTKIHEPFLGSGVSLYNSNAGGIGIDCDPIVVELHNSLLDSELPFKVEQKYRNYFGDDVPTKDAFLTLRGDFNSQWKADGLTRDNIASLWVLGQLSFNSLLRFGPNGYNAAFGDKRLDLARIKQHVEIRETLPIEITVGSYLDLDLTQVSITDDLIYIDPPYVASKFQYGGWNGEDELRLLRWIDELSRLGYNWVLSNTFLHRGIENSDLIEWSKSYNSRLIKMSYNAWSARVKSVQREDDTVEVLITNIDSAFNDLAKAHE